MALHPASHKKKKGGSHTPEHRLELSNAVIDKDIATGNFTKRSFKRRQGTRQANIERMGREAEIRSNVPDVSGETPRERVVRTGAENEVTRGDLKVRFDARHADRVRRVEEENERRAGRGARQLPVPLSPEERADASAVLDDKLKFKKLLRFNERAGGDSEDLQERLEQFNASRVAKGKSPLRLDPATAKDGIEGTAIIDARGMSFEEFQEHATPADRAAADARIEDSFLGEDFLELRREEAAIAKDSVNLDLTPGTSDALLAKTRAKMDRLRHQFMQSSEFEDVTKSPYPRGQGVGDIWEQLGQVFTRDENGIPERVGDSPTSGEGGAKAEKRERDKVNQQAKVDKVATDFNADLAKEADARVQAKRQSFEDKPTSDKELRDAMRSILKNRAVAEELSSEFLLPHLGTGYSRDGDLIVAPSGAKFPHTHRNGKLYPVLQAPDEAAGLEEGTPFVDGNTGALFANERETGAK